MTIVRIIINGWLTSTRLSEPVKLPCPWCGCAQGDTQLHLMSCEIAKQFLRQDREWPTKVPLLKLWGIKPVCAQQLQRLAMLCAAYHKVAHSDREQFRALCLAKRNAELQEQLHLALEFAADQFRDWQGQCLRAQLPAAESSAANSTECFVTSSASSNNKVAVG